jgi:hypothetical protein
MARLFSTGFEAGAGSILGWVGSDASVGTNKRNGSYGLTVNGWLKYLNIPIPTLGSAFFVRVALNLPDAAAKIALKEGSTTHLAVGIATYPTRQVLAYRDTTTLGTYTGELSPLPSNWFCLEIGGVIHDTTGSVVVKINGQTVLSLENVDTRNGGTGIVDTLAIAENAVGNQFYADDIDINDKATASFSR